MIREKIREEDLIPFLKSEYPSDKIWKSFYKMWMDSKGYDYRDGEYIVDGCRDGGIDAIAYPKPHMKLKISVIQSKHFQGAVTKFDLKRFFEAVSVFRNGSEEEFMDWVTTVPRKGLRPHYRHLWSKRKDLDFVIVTSGKLDKESILTSKKLKIQIEDKNSVIAHFKDMAQGKSPRPTEITLKKRGRILPIIENDEHGLYVFASPLIDFAKCFQDERNNLFAGNVREGIGGSSSEVNKGIERTLAERPHDFAYFHNGITIVCKKIIPKGSKVILVSPSIVNGAQTVTYLGETLAGKIPANATVLVKAIEVEFEGGFEEFETDVAMSSNTQNKVKLSDLSVVNPSLVSIERYFKSNRCFLERKRGSKPLVSPEIKITKDRLLQLFSSLESNLGPSMAKDIQSLYKNHARELFKKYNSSVDKRRDALFIARLDRLVSSTLREFKGSGVRGKRKARRLSFSSFTIFAATAFIIKDKKMWSKIRSSFNDDGIKDSLYADQLKRDIRKIAAVILAISKKDKELNDAGFFKSKTKVADAIKVVRKKMKSKVRFHQVK